MTSRESSQYFSEQPPGTEVRRTVTARVWGRELKLITGSGVFAADGLDRGTAVLLRASPIPVGSPRILDLGCGYGPIALAVAVHCPGALVDAVDVNERALGLCRDNAEALGVADRVRVLRPDEVDPETRYDEIWSNPPIRIGKQALHELLLAWLPRLAVRRRGTSGGRQEPWRGHPAAVADRAGLRVRARRLRERLPSTAGPRSALRTSLQPRPLPRSYAQHEWRWVGWSVVFRAKGHAAQQRAPGPQLDHPWS